MYRLTNPFQYPVDYGLKISDVQPAKKDLLYFQFVVKLR